MKPRAGLAVTFAWALCCASTGCSSESQEDRAEARLVSPSPGFCSKDAGADARPTASDVEKAKKQCVVERTEARCLSHGTQCGWDGSLRSCEFVGCVEIQPGSGDPGVSHVIDNGSETTEPVIEDPPVPAVPRSPY